MDRLIVEKTNLCFRLDGLLGYASLLMDMPTTHKRNYDYPDKTRGSETARRIRTDANKLTASERTEIHRRAMQLIYAGTGNKETVRSGQ